MNWVIASSWDFCTNNWGSNRKQSENTGEILKETKKNFVQKKKFGLVSPISGDLFPRELGTIMEISSNKMLPS